MDKVRIPVSSALGVVAIASLGVWSCLHGLYLIAVHTSVLFDGQMADSMRGYYLGESLRLCVYLVLGFGLIFLRYPIANALFFKEPPELTADPDHLFSLGLAIFGAALAAFSIVEAAQVEGTLLLSRVGASGDEAIFREHTRAFLLQNWSSRVGYLAKGAVGVGLFLGADGLAALRNRLRNAGRDRS